MLTLQNLDLDTHVKLKKNEILEKEVSFLDSLILHIQLLLLTSPHSFARWQLKFYAAALNAISTSSAVLAGFAFSGLAMSVENKGMSERLLSRTLYNISSTLCVMLNLLTLCAATFTSLFAVRLALRGSGDSVEKSVKSVRGGEGKIEKACWLEKG